MLDRSLPPAFQKTIALTLPDPAETVLSSGIRIYHLKGLRQHIVKIEVLFNGGKWVETKTGLSHFTSMMLEKGTASRSSTEIANILDLYGANLEISSGFDFVSVSLYVLRDKLKDVFPVFIEIISQPSFEESEWAQMQDIFLQNLKISNEKTSYLASKLIRKNVFGETHPYGSSVEEADARLISPDDLKHFFNAAFTIHSAYILGDLSDQEVEFLQDNLKGLPAGQQQVLSPPVNLVKPFTAHAGIEGRTQSSIRLGKKSILKTHADYPDLLLVTHLLGGFFGSRLMKNIREEKGLTYGISSSVNTFRNDSMFIIGADVNKENVSMALVEIRKELRKLIEIPVGDQELRLAKNHFTGSLQTDMANLFSVEEKIKNIHLNGLDKHYYQLLLNRIDMITPQQIMLTAAQYLGEDSFYEVVVG